VKIECALDQLARSGKKQTIQFKADVYGHIYLDHLGVLETWKRDNPTLWSSLENNMKDGIQ